MTFGRSKKIKKLPDLELINRYRYSYDNNYIGELYQRYTHLVFGTCLKYLQSEDDAKDAVMQIFEKAMDDLKRHQVENFKGWIHKVAKNHCLMHLRKNKTEFSKEEKFLNSSQIVMEFDGALHPGNGVEKEDVLNNLEAAIDLLKVEQKQCVKLFYLDEMSYKDVAEETGFSVKQVKSYIQNGKRNLKNYLSQNSNE